MINMENIGLPILKLSFLITYEEQCIVEKKTKNFPKREKMFKSSKLIIYALFSSLYDRNFFISSLIKSDNDKIMNNNPILQMGTSNNPNFL